MMMALTCAPTILLLDMGDLGFTLVLIRLRRHPRSVMRHGFLRCASVTLPELVLKELTGHNLLRFQTHCNKPT